ncbi:omptin family outer membrane protease [Rhizobium sp. LEGMi198b]
MRCGANVDANDVDNHWLRNLDFEDKFGAHPFVSICAKAVYQMTGRVSLFFAGNFDQYFRRKGGYDGIRHVDQAAEVGSYKDGAGMDLYALTLAAGFKLTF